jgi:hypothetical protein
MESANWLIHLFNQYPELLAVFSGLMIGALASITWEVGFCPPAWDYARSARVAAAISIAISSFWGYVIWRWLDPADPRAVDLTVSIGSAIGGPGFVFVLSRVLQWKWPSLDLSMGKRSAGAK